jgi:hypothetical protein
VILEHFTNDVFIFLGLERTRCVDAFGGRKVECGVEQFAL